MKGYGFWKISLTGLIIVVLVIGVAKCSGVATANPNAWMETPYEDAVGNVAEIARLWEENEAAADKEFYGKRVVIGGEVTEISRATIGDDYCVCAKAGETEFVMFFDETYRDQLSTISIGDKVVAKGEFSRKWFTILQFAGCMLAE